MTSLVKPTNQASFSSSLVPVLPATYAESAAMERAVPRAVADKVDHLAIAISCLSVIAARLVHHSEAVPAVMHVGEAAEQAASASSSLPAQTRSTTALEAASSASS